MASVTRRAAIGQGLRIGAVGLGVALGLGGMVGQLPAVRVVRAQAAETPVFGAWAPSDFADYSYRVFAPATGILLADSNGVLRRSDDGGVAWREVPLPTLAPSVTPRIVVDPTDHMVIHVRAGGTLHRTADGAVTWQQLPTTFFEGVGGSVGPAVSPVDPAVMFAATRSGDQFSIGRSLDRGDTWEPVLDEPKPGHLAVRFVRPHPLDAQRVTFGMEYRPREDRPPEQWRAGERDRLRDEVYASGNQGTSWTVGLAPTLHAWVGGMGAQAGSLWTLGTDVTVGAPPRGRSWPSMFTRVYRSTDDGASWADIHTAGETQSDKGPIRTVLAADPTRADRLFATLPGADQLDRGFFVTQRSPGHQPNQIMVSTDSGRTWQLAGTGAPPTVYALEVAIDGRTLFAGTDRGVWRLALT